MLGAVFLALGPGMASAVASELAPAAAVQRVLPRAEKAGTVTSADVYAGSLEDVQQALDPQAVPHSTTIPSAPPKSGWEPPSPATAVDLVVFQGEFADGDVPTPPKAGAPKGHVMAFTVNPKTGWVLETYVGDISPEFATGAAGRARPTLKLRLKLNRAELRRLARHSRHRTRRH